MFKIASRQIADVEPFSYYAGAAGLKNGEAVVLTAGALTAASGKPTHIIAGPENARGQYPVIPVLPTTRFETVSTATVAPALVGSAVTLSPDAMGVTATTTSGVFTITETDGATTNSTVRGYFK